MQVGKQSGYAYLAVLILIATLGIGVSRSATTWSQNSKRLKEKELLFIGKQFKRAIQQYYESSPGVKKYPSTLEDLIKDSRHPTTRRYLRRIYRDPISGSPEWGTIKSPEGGIMGVFSQAEGIPLKQTGFPEEFKIFDGQPRYSDWPFIYQPVIYGNVKGTPSP